MNDANSFGINNADPRVQALRAAEALAKERALALERLSSPLHSPEERIRLWEKLHALSLPRAPTHPLLSLIASQTSLTLEQVQDERRRRATELEQR